MRRLTDNCAGGHAIAAHFLATGHNRIGYIAGFEGASTQIDRERGFREGLSAGGASLVARGVGGFGYDGARDATLQMFAGPDRPDAVFVCNDHMAFAAMDALRFTLGLRVPEDVRHGLRRRLHRRRARLRPHHLSSAHRPDGRKLHRDPARPHRRPQRPPRGASCSTAN